MFACSNRRVRLWALTLFGCLILAGSAANAADKGGPRIFISSDMEGVAGVVTGEQLGTSGFEYERFRKFYTLEVLAAIEGARAAGAGDIVVTDGHGNTQSLLIEMLPPDVTLIRGEPRPLSMMEGIQNKEFDGVMFIGYHASASNTHGVRAHTMSSGRISELRINGIPASEGLVNAAIAGEYDVPVILVSGDDAAVEEVATAIGNVERAVVKRAIAFHSAENMTPSAAQDLIRGKAKYAVQHIAEFQPYVVHLPVTCDVTFHYYRLAELFSWLAFVDRTGARSVRFSAPTMTKAQTTMTFMLNYDAHDLEP